MGNFNINDNPQGLGAIPWLINGLKTLWRRVNGISGGGGGGGTTQTLQQTVNIGNVVDAGGTVKTMQFTNAPNSITINAQTQIVTMTDSAGNVCHFNFSNINFADSAGNTSSIQAKQISLINNTGDNFSHTADTLIFTPNGGQTKTLDFSTTDVAALNTYKFFNFAGGGTLALVDYPIANISGTTATISVANDGWILATQSGSATTVTVPTNASQAFPIGAVVALLQDGAGKLTVSAAGGVTILSKGSNLSASAQNVMIFLIKKATNTWWLIGDLIA